MTKKSFVAEVACNSIEENLCCKLSNLTMTWANFLNSIGMCHAGLIMLLKLLLNHSLSLICTIFLAFSKI